MILFKKMELSKFGFYLVLLLSSVLADQLDLQNNDINSDNDTNTDDNDSEIDDDDQGSVCFTLARANLEAKQKMFYPPVAPDSPSYRHLVPRMGGPHSQQLTSYNKLFEEALNICQEKFDWNVKNPYKKYRIPEDVLSSCTRLHNITGCSASDKYRTANGSCNNLQQPSWGMAQSCMNRILPANYGDGVSEYRKSQSGDDLPPPRLITKTIHHEQKLADEKVTMLFTSFGEYMALELIVTPLTSKGLSLDGENKILKKVPLVAKTINCCAGAKLTFPECGEIDVTGDEFYSQHKVTCVNNLRSLGCGTCSFGARTQIIGETAFIDASGLYSPDDEEMDKMRNKTGSGTLKVQVSEESGIIPPKSSDPNQDGCSFQNLTSPCLEAGGSHFISSAQVTELQTLLMRQHNRIAERLAKLNPQWDDDKNFQETRRIIGAQLQVIVYGEYLPVLLGPDRSPLLHIQRGPVYTRYHPNIHPGILNEFAAAAGRYGHVMTNKYFPEFPNVTNQNFALKDNFFYPFALYQGQFDNLLNGLAKSQSFKCNRHMVTDLTNHLYKLRHQAHGLDLSSLDVFRGRDHGLPRYVDMVKVCGGPHITSFDQLRLLFYPGSVEAFQKVYYSYSDIDLFSGGVAEIPQNGAIVGPTFACIIASQYLRLKLGDRFYFENGGQSGSFTMNQLQELKKTSLAQLICKNTKIDYVQREAFLNANRLNRYIQCEDFLDIDLLPWKE